MDKIQKDHIIMLRRSGSGFSEISEKLGISRDTVKSFCVRNNISVGECRECGCVLTRAKGIKKRVFCSDKCRIKWWNEHPNKKTADTLICAGCGKHFLSYGSSHRKYCSHKCYISDRFRGGISHE